MQGDNSNRSTPTSPFGWMKWARGVHGAGITRAQKQVLLGLATYADPDGHCYPGETSLADDTGLARESISRAISGLRAHGLVFAVQTRWVGSGRFSRNEYDLRWRYFEPKKVKQKKGKERNRRVISRHTGKTPENARKANSSNTSQDKTEGLGRVISGHPDRVISRHTGKTPENARKANSSNTSQDKTEGLGRVISGHPDRVISRHIKSPSHGLPSSEVSREEVSRDSREETYRNRRNDRTFNEAKQQTKRGDEDAAKQRVQHAPTPPSSEDISSPPRSGGETHTPDKTTPLGKAYVPSTPAVGARADLLKSSQFWDEILDGLDVSGHEF